MKNIYLIVGPSGSGKSTIANILERKYGLKQVVSFTERPPRYESETGHVFISAEDFDKLDEQPDNLCAFTVFNGYRYGVPAKMVDECDIYLIDPAGVRYMREHYHGPKGIRVIGLYADADVCKQRMLARGDTKKNVAARLEHDHHAFAPQNIEVVDSDRVILVGLHECCDTVFHDNFVSVPGMDALASMIHTYIMMEEHR